MESDGLAFVCVKAQRTSHDSRSVDRNEHGTSRIRSKSGDVLLNIV